MVSRSLTSLSTSGAGIQIFEIHFAVPVPPSCDSWKKLMLTIAQNWEWRERCQMEVCHDWMAWSFVPISNTFVRFAVGKTESLEGSCLSSGALEVRKSNTLQSLITLLQSSAELHLRFQSTLYTNHYRSRAFQAAFQIQENITCLRICWETSFPFLGKVQPSVHWSKYT